MKPSPTNETTNLILNFFLRNKIFARRHGVMSGTASYTKKNGDTKERYIHGGITGGSDTFVWLPYPAPWLGVEIKTGPDKLSPVQIGFNRQIEMMGHLTIHVKDYPDFLLQVIPIFNKFHIPLIYGLPEKSS
jgi:hypothetical protein